MTTEPTNKPDDLIAVNVRRETWPKIERCAVLRKESIDNLLDRLIERDIAAFYREQALEAGKNEG